MTEPATLELLVVAPWPRLALNDAFQPLAEVLVPNPKPALAFGCPNCERAGVPPPNWAVMPCPWSPQLIPVWLNMLDPSEWVGPLVPIC